MLVFRARAGWLEAKSSILELSASQARTDRDISTLSVSFLNSQRLFLAFRPLRVPISFSQPLKRGLDATFGRREFQFRTLSLSSEGWMRHLVAESSIFVLSASQARAECDIWSPRVSFSYSQPLMRGLDATFGRREFQFRTLSLSSEGWLRHLVAESSNFVLSAFQAKAGCDIWSLRVRFSNSQPERGLTQPPPGESIYFHSSWRLL
ncbi:hypothetical protein SAMN05428962_4499 [Paenibacillus sp. BC26]|nr:hypothetical protein SAMN05428962_4499 [Paenibacillus sp. BC26]